MVNAAPRASHPLPVHLNKPALQRIDGIQALRAVAALLVVCFHIQASATQSGFTTLFSLLHRGEAGVDLFFVISGFIIYYTSCERPGLTPRTFLAFRFLRIYPAYWALLSIYLAGLVAAHVMHASAPGAGSGGLGSVLVSIALFPYPDQILAVAWTLTVEVTFYLVFCLTFFRFGPRGFFAAMAAWALAAQLYKYAGGTPAPALSLVPYSGVIEFLFGAIVAHLYLERRTRWALLSLFFGAALVLVDMADLYAQVGWSPGREWRAGVPSALLLYGVVGVPAALPQWLMLLGEASYVLYLVHLLAISVLIRVYEKATGLSIFASSWSAAALLVAVVGLAIALHVYLERPFQRWYKARLPAPAKPAPADTSGEVRTASPTA